MNIYNALLPVVSLYYPLGTTPSVCLTQDLPPELEADILLLGCGDARNILFTCFADRARKIDVTCCDIEPMIHARNVLLFTLLIDDKSNRNIEKIWSIYFTYIIDESALDLLQSQVQKLLLLSESIDQWHGSVYGSYIRFCDEKSLSCVTRYWWGFMLEGFSDSIHRAKDMREQLRSKPNGMGYRSTFPTSMNANPWSDLSKVTDHWWNRGVTPFFKLLIKRPHFNPAFLNSPDNPLTMFAGTSPVGGIPLSTAYAAVSEDSPFFLKTKSPSFSEHLVDCAKNIFEQWAVAFRKSMANGSVIRIFSGDALAFCLTLRNCQLTGSTSMNLFRHNLTCAPLILHHSSYGHNSNNAAPVSFDVIDTSDLIDYLGPLNLICAASSLLKHHVTSCLYTELLSMHVSDPIVRFNELFGVDVRSMALFLGLVLPDVFTNATNSVEEYGCLDKPNKYQSSWEPITLVRSRLRWKQAAKFQASDNSQNVQVEAKELAKFLVQVHNTMFLIDDLGYRPSDPPKAGEVKRCKIDYRPYSRASFAFLLSSLKENVVCNWDECIKEILDGISVKEYYETFKEDLALSLHVFGVDSSLFTKPDLADMGNPILASVLPKSEILPEQLCVTTQVHRKDLGFLTEIESYGSMMFRAIICSFETGTNVHSFSSVQIAFGKWCKKTAENSNPYIEEDNAQQWGFSDMFVSVFVPTLMLTSIPKESVVKCRFKRSILNIIECGRQRFENHSFSTSKLTSENVFITRFMPGMSELPKFTANSQQNLVTSGEFTVRISSDGSKINSIVRRITLQSEAAKAEAAKNKVSLKIPAAKVKFQSPLTAIVRIAGSSELKLEFPVPVSTSKYSVKIEPSYVEVESPFFDPLEEDAPSFLFPCFLMNAGNSSIPAPWTSTRVDLDTMPSLDLRDFKKLSWLFSYNLQMLTMRENRIIVSKTIYDFRTTLKRELMLLFSMFCGTEGPRKDFFMLDIVKARVKTFIFPSCARLDLTNNSVMLDSAVIFLTKKNDDPVVAQFLLQICKMGVGSIEVKESEYLAWKFMMPALVERCRTWQHSKKCKYVKAGEVPLSSGNSPVCSCGIGKFPAGYLEDKMEKIPTLRYILDHYATRAVISPIFSVQYLEDCDTGKFQKDRCEHCSSDTRKDPLAKEQSLLKCSACKNVFYCSRDCQRKDWKKHRPLCYDE